MAYYNNYIENGYKNTRGDVEFLEAISTELCEMELVNPFHNKHINSVTEQSGSTYQYVCVPSKYYVFDTFGKGDDERRNFGKGPKDTPMHYVISHDISQIENYHHPECVLQVNGYYSTYRSLQVIRELSKYHESLSLRRIHIANPRLNASDTADNKDSELTELFFETLKFKDARSVHFENTNLPYHVYKNITRKLCECQVLERFGDWHHWNSSAWKSIRCPLISATC